MRERGADIRRRRRRDCIDYAEEKWKRGSIFGKVAEGGRMEEKVGRRR